METYEFSGAFEMGSLLVTPVHVRIEQLQPIIAAHTHSRTSYEIHYTRSGHGTVTIDGVTREVSGDTLYITGPGVVHAQISPPGDPIVEYCLYLNCQRIYRSAQDPFAIFADTGFWMGEDRGQVYPLLQRMIEENRNPLSGAREMSETLVRQIIILLVRMYRQQKNLKPAVMSAPVLTRAGFMPIIEDAFFYRYRTLSLSDLAQLLGLSVRQTQRVLKDNFGKTFSQKLADARMAAASQFLINTNLTISEISDRLGFSSIEHFSAAFRRYMDISARDYRKMHRAENREAPFLQKPEEAIRPG